MGASSSIGLRKIQGFAPTGRSYAAITIFPGVPRRIFSNPK